MTEVTILEQNQYIIKILGIQISDNLQETITLNWQNNLEKRKIIYKKCSLNKYPCMENPS